MYTKECFKEKLLNEENQTMHDPFRFADFCKTVKTEARTKYTRLNVSILNHCSLGFPDFTNLRAHVA